MAASFFTRDHASVVRRWKREGGLPAVAGSRVRNPLTTGPVDLPLGLELDSARNDYRIVPSGEIVAASLGDAAHAGTFVIFDWVTKRAVWEADWGTVVYTPSGFCFDDSHLFVSDLEGSSVFMVDLLRQRGKLLERISHSYMNDLHGIERTSRGLLLASSGTDAVLELGLDGSLLYEWWAADHGYDVAPCGLSRSSGRGREHRDRYYHTRLHTTHLNAATFRDIDERFLLVVLFHQGQIIQVDRWAAYGARPEVLIEGLARPHALTRVPGGWMIANSAASEVVFYDDSFKRARPVALGVGWIQDVTRLSNGNVLANDVDQHCVVEFAPPDPRPLDRMNYNPNWRMAELMELPPRFAEAFS